MQQETNENDIRKAYYITLHAQEIKLFEDKHPMA
jgi:hypothetical protein